MSDSEEEGIWNTPPELGEAANKLKDNSLPPKSREKYQSVYDTFINWSKSKKVSNITENVLLEYFGELAEKCKPTTLWAMYSMLRSTLNIYNKLNIENFKQLGAFLRQKSSGYVGKKSKIFTASEIKNFLDTAPDDDYLATKVVLIFGICGACRNGELTKLTINDIQNGAGVMVIKLRDTKNNTERNFTIEGEFLNKVTTYQALRPKNSTCDRFFLNYKKGKCTNQAIGKNKLGKMPTDIASFLNLPNPEEYTGHSFRRSSATLCADTGTIFRPSTMTINSGTDMAEIKKLRDLKSTAVAEEYIEESIGYKRKAEQQISSDTAMPSPTFEEVSYEKRPKKEISEITHGRITIPSTSETITDEICTEAPAKKHSTVINFNNCSNITVYF